MPRFAMANWTVATKQIENGKGLYIVVYKFTWAKEW